MFETKPRVRPQRRPMPRPVSHTQTLARETDEDLTRRVASEVKRSIAVALIVAGVCAALGMLL